MPKQYPRELRERAVRLVAEHRGEYESGVRGDPLHRREAERRHAGDAAAVDPQGRGLCRKAAGCDELRPRQPYFLTASSNASA